MKVIFMGTPEFALPALRALINSQNHEVSAVFTQRPKAKGRGWQKQNSPVAELALAHNIPLYTPVSMKQQEVINIIDSIEADIIVVVAYGFIIPSAILEAKKYGCVNIHPSRLPRHRGAAPLQHSILSGDKETAVTIIQMDQGVDTGDILLSENLIIKESITLDELSKQCAEIGSRLLIKVLDNIGSLKPIKQSNIGVSYAAKFNKEDGRINWSDDARKIERMIRAMNPWPGVYFTHKGQNYRIFEAVATNQDSSALCGTVIDNQLQVACGNGTLIIKKIQLEGRKILNSADFLRGSFIKKGTLLTEPNS